MRTTTVQDTAHMDESLRCSESSHALASGGYKQIKEGNDYEAITLKKTKTLKNIKAVLTNIFIATIIILLYAFVRSASESQLKYRNEYFQARTYLRLSAMLQKGNTYEAQSEINYQLKLLMAFFGKNRSSHFRSIPDDAVLQTMRDIVDHIEYIDTNGVHIVRGYPKRKDVLNAHINRLLKDLE